MIDPAHWIDPKFHITTDLAHFKQLPSYYLEVKPRTNGKPK